jgi:tetratricopeptide (TPR) repeat protein
MRELLRLVSTSFKQKTAWTAIVLLLFAPSGSYPQEVSGLENDVLFAKANRAFLSRNFLAAEKYFRELSNRLKTQLSTLPSSDSPDLLEIHEVLIIAPFGLGHSLLFLHRYEQSREALETGLRLYPDWAANHIPLDFLEDPAFTGPVLKDLQSRMKNSQETAAILIFGYIQFFRGNLDEASTAFSQILAANPKDYFAKYFSEQIRKTRLEDPAWKPLPRTTETLDQRNPG